MDNNRDDGPRSPYSREQVRRCLSVCLYAVEYNGPTREYARKMANMIMNQGTVLARADSALACIDLALDRDADLIGSFDVGGLPQNAVLGYLRMLQEEISKLI